MRRPITPSAAAVRAAIERMRRNLDDPEFRPIKSDLRVLVDLLEPVAAERDAARSERDALWERCRDLEVRMHHYTRLLLPARILAIVFLLMGIFLGFRHMSFISGYAIGAGTAIYWAAERRRL